MLKEKNAILSSKTKFPVNESKTCVSCGKKHGKIIVEVVKIVLPVAKRQQHLR